MGGQVGVDPGHELFQPHDHPLHSGLICSVVVLDAREEVRQAPVRVGLNLEQGVVGDVAVVHHLPAEDIANGPSVVPAQEDHN